LKEAFADFAAQADALRQNTQAELATAPDDAERGALTARLQQIETDLAGARRDVGVAIENAAVLGDAAAFDACQQIDERAAELARAADRLFSDADVAEALRRISDGEMRWTGQGLREVALRVNIDELVAVANNGAWDDPANKRFSESMTNQVTKNDLEEQNAIPALPVITQRDARDAGPEAFQAAALGMFDRRFSEVVELTNINDAARAAMRNLDRDDGALKKSVERRDLGPHRPWRHRRRRIGATSFRGRRGANAAARAVALASRLSRVRDG
jgi:hypothetical protein